MVVIETRYLLGRGEEDELIEVAGIRDKNNFGTSGI